MRKNFSRLAIAGLILTGAVGGALSGVALVGDLRGAQAQSGANTRMFDVGDGEFPPTGVPVYYMLGSIASLTRNRDYRFTLTAAVSWSDVGSTERGVGLAFDVDGFDVNGDAVDWGSELYPRANEQYTQTHGQSRDRAMIAQSIVYVPDEVVTLKVQVLDQSGYVAQTPPQFRALRLTMTPTGPPF